MAWTRLRRNPYGAGYALKDQGANPLTSAMEDYLK